MVRALRIAGPGLLVAVGYMDPGNWATDIGAGSRYGAGLMVIVLASGLAAMLFQNLALRLGIATGRNLAELMRDRYRPLTVFCLWLLAELAIVATDFAELLGSALALQLLFGLPLLAGMVLTALDVIVVLAIQGRNRGNLLGITAGLIGVITLCLGIELAVAAPSLQGVVGTLLPNPSMFVDHDALLLAAGLVGATIMPHNLYLHSAMVQNWGRGEDARARSTVIRGATRDMITSLSVATLVNAAILILAAACFHDHLQARPAGIGDAYRLILSTPALALTAPLFAIALLASGQSATITGTMAGETILEGFWRLHLPAWQRRLLTRAMALVPAIILIRLWGEGSVDYLLVLSQVILSAALPFSMLPLILFTRDRALMGEQTSGRSTTVLAIALFVVISLANVGLILSAF